jgi:YVTN family beta-propeller protein
MDFRILGPLEVGAGNGSVQLGAAKQRAVLALLLLRAREIVSMEQIIDELWGDDPPSSAVKLVQTYVSRLRKALAEGSRDVILTRAPGYAVNVQPSELDADRFKRAIADARRAASRERPEEAAGLFADALAMWRGRPAEDVVLNRNAGGEIDRLAELRATAQLERLAVELDLGRHGAAIGELKSRVAEDPFAERPRAMLMLALYRDGRQAESLEAFRDARRTMVEELGVEPGAELRELHRRILAQDASLEPPPRPAAAEPLSGAVTDARPARKRPRRRLVLALSAVAALVGAAVAILATGGSGGAPQLRANQVGLIESGDVGLARAVAVGRRPTSVAVSRQSLWTTNLDDRTLSEIDLGNLHAVRSIGTPTAPTAVVATPDAAWVVEEFADRVERIDARTGTADATISVGTSPAAVAVGYQSVWVANRGDGTVSRIDPSTLKVASVIRVGPGPSGIATGANGVWVTGGLSKRVVQIDPRSESVTRRIGLRYPPGAVAVGGGRVWVLQPFNDAISRINPQSGSVDATANVGDTPVAVAVADGWVWVADKLGREVQRIDPATGQPDAEVRLDAYPSGLAPGDGGVWVTGQGLG